MVVFVCFKTHMFLDRLAIQRVFVIYLLVLPCLVCELSLQRPKRIQRGLPTWDSKYPEEKETGTLWGPHFYVFLKHFLTNII